MYLFPSFMYQKTSIDAYCIGYTALNTVFQHNNSSLRLSCTLCWLNFIIGSLSIISPLYSSHICIRPFFCIVLQKNHDDKIVTENLFRSRKSSYTIENCMLCRMKYIFFSILELLAFWNLLFHWVIWNSTNYDHRLFVLY